MHNYFVAASMTKAIRQWAFSFALAAPLLFSACHSTPTEKSAPQLAGEVKQEFLHAWQNYERYAWGHDALKPLSKTPHDWYGESLLMTPVDALDTLLIMKLDAEAARTRELIANNLSFDRDVYVKNFEITIRLLGGLLSGYQLSGDRRLLLLADDLGKTVTSRSSSHLQDCLTSWSTFAPAQ